MSDKEEQVENDFSIELRSNRDLTRISSSNDTNGVLIEGTLGRLHHASFVDDIILEVRGSNGILRLNLRKEDLDRLSATKTTKDLTEGKR